MRSPSPLPKQCSLNNSHAENTCCDGGNGGGGGGEFKEIREMCPNDTHTYCFGVH